MVVDGAFWIVFQFLPGSVYALHLPNITYLMLGRLLPVMSIWIYTILLRK